MAEITNLQSMQKLRAALEAMTEPELLGQQISSHGAIHVLDYLLRVGCSQELVEALLVQLRDNVDLVCEVARRKGFTVFTYDAAVVGMQQ
jgi:hypothetical protein